MKRFIRYLYEYEKGRRTRNVGFVKVEQGDDECIVHIHGKGLRMGGRQKLQLYLFYEDGGTCVGIYQGEIDNINPSVNYMLRYTDEDVGIPENFPRIDGIIMGNDGHRKYAAVWDDMPVDVDHMQIWQPQEQPEEERQIEPQPEEEEQLQEQPEEERQIEPQPEEEEQPQEQPEEERQIELQPEEELQPQVQSAAASVKLRKARKIQRKDLAGLPRCEWRLANNHFLLHGYYNYRHLMLIEEGKRMLLGVPGIYHEEEARVAAALGFPEFVPVEQITAELHPDECDDQERFGYWCRQVKVLRSCTSFREQQ